MEEKDSKDQVQDLLKENLLLRTELNFYKSKQSGKGLFRNLIGRTSSNLLVGKGLKSSIKKLYNEIPEKNVTRDSLAEFTSQLILRITRIGIFAILTFAIPFLLLSVQTYILNNQNKLLQYQNKRLDQQINLEEGNRRSSLVFLMSNLMDKIGEEANRSGNNGRLSEALISRIISLSQAFRPYRYLENDQLIDQPRSPERGQLLLSLVNSNLSEEVYEKIFLKANFSYADLAEANLVNAYLEGVNLKHANLFKTNFQGAELDYAHMDGANLVQANFDNALMNHISLVQANLTGSSLDNVEMEYGNLLDANLTSAVCGGDFSFTNIRGIKIDNLTFKFVELEGVEFANDHIFQELEKYQVSGKDYIDENFELEEKEIKDSSQNVIDRYFIFHRKKDSMLGLLEECQNTVLTIIKRTKRIQLLEQEAIKKKDPLVFLVKAHPFGEESLNIIKDTLYRYDLTTEKQINGRRISQLIYDPDDAFVTEITLTDTGNII